VRSVGIDFTFVGVCQADWPNEDEPSLRAREAWAAREAQQLRCGNRDLDDPTDVSHAGLFRGFILQHSDVGAPALTLDVFLYRAICGNNS
jgi:hypothetical protein